MKSIFLGTLIPLFLTTALLAQDSIVGIGVSLGADRATGDLKVTKVIPGGPADKAGVPAGVILRKVNDVDLSGKRLTDCIALIRGPIGSKVNIEVVDPTAHTTNHFEIARDKIVLAPPKRSHRGDPAAPLK